VGGGHARVNKGKGKMRQKPAMTAAGARAVCRCVGVSVGAAAAAAATAGACVRAGRVHAPGGGEQSAKARGWGSRRGGGGRGQPGCRWHRSEAGAGALSTDPPPPPPTNPPPSHSAICSMRLSFPYAKPKPATQRLAGPGGGASSGQDPGLEAAPDHLSWCVGRSHSPCAGACGGGGAGASETGRNPVPGLMVHGVSASAAAAAAAVCTWRRHGGHRCRPPSAVDEGCHRY
jgi:hypothetical protein